MADFLKKKDSKSRKYLQTNTLGDYGSWIKKLQHTEKQSTFTLYNFILLHQMQSFHFEGKKSV